jgi:Zn-dependent peptidase ImmA (M78 family)/transcriptional regulator with XRE-family HTH domain
MDALFEVAEPTANPQLVVAAREALGWTQAQLAARMSELAVVRPGISQGYVSRVEKGALDATGERLELLARALRCTSEFLASDAKLWSLGDGCLYHRNRASTKASTLRQLHARVNLAYLHLRRMAQIGGSTLPDPLPLGRAVGGALSSRDVARQVRADVGCPVGAIASVTVVAERLGALVVHTPLGGREVDATSLHPPGECPLMVVNTDAPTDRQRFTLAHEIGHVVCVPAPGADAEEMAQRFAGEFLAPAQQILPDLRATVITPARLLQLKSTWGVSAAAVLKRARDLGVVNESRQRTLSAEIAALGWRTAEPEPPPAETGAVVPQIVERAVRAAGGVEPLARAVGTTAETLAAMFGADTTALTERGE